MNNAIKSLLFATLLPCLLLLAPQAQAKTYAWFDIYVINNITANDVDGATPSIKIDKYNVDNCKNGCTWSKTIDAKPTSDGDAHSKDIHIQGNTDKSVYVNFDLRIKTSANAGYTKLCSVSFKANKFNQFTFDQPIQGSSSYYKCVFTMKDGNPQITTSRQ